VVTCRPLAGLWVGQEAREGERRGMEEREGEVRGGEGR